MQSHAFVSGLTVEGQHTHSIQLGHTYRPLVSLDELICFRYTNARVAEYVVRCWQELQEFNASGGCSTTPAQTTRSSARHGMPVRAFEVD